MFELDDIKLISIRFTTFTAWGGPLGVINYKLTKSIDEYSLLGWK